MYECQHYNSLGTCRVVSEKKVRFFMLQCYVEKIDLTKLMVYGPINPFGLCRAVSLSNYSFPGQT